jgi:hypothetical protein
VFTVGSITITSLYLIILLDRDMTNCGGGLQFHMSIAVPGTRYRTGPELTVDPVVGYAIAAVVAVVGLLLLLRNLGSKGRRRGPDVVRVRDRSLGGKMVRYPC